MNPLEVRVARTFDPADRAGVMYPPMYRCYTVTATSAGTANLWVMPAGTYVTRVWAQIETGFSGAGGNGTLEVGVDSNLDEFIDSADWTEHTDDQFVTNVGSSNADSPNGKYFPTGGTLKATVAGDIDEGEARIFVEYFLFDEIFGSDFGANWDFDVP